MFIVWFMTAICVILAGYNVWRTDRHAINASTVTLLLCGFLGFLVATGVVKSLKLFGAQMNFLEKIDERSKNANRNAKAALEATGMMFINQNRYSSQEAAKAEVQLGVKFLKDAYGEEYKERTKRLIDDKYLRVNESEFIDLGIKPDQEPSKKPPIIESLKVRGSEE